jgi:hypothetical protein
MCQQFQTVCFLPSVASMDEVINSASGPLLPLLPRCFEMDQESYSKLMASLHERHLVRMKNLLPQKWQQQQQQQPQPRQRRRAGGCRLLLQARTDLATVLIEEFALSLKG